MKQIEEAERPQSENEQQQLQLKMKFNYRQAIGELVFAMCTCRPDIAFPVIKLSQYSVNPSEIHYKTVISIFQYLHATRTQGITYWRKEPNTELPYESPPKYQTSNYEPSNTTATDSPTKLHGSVDSDWANDTSHRKSVTGIVLRLAGGTVYYKTKFQETIAQSTTEAEFTAGCDAGKAILYVRSILDQINMPQEEATALFIDNNGALLMGNAQKPTRRTRHMDIKKFILQDWIQQDLIIMKRINTADNYADGMTKSVGRQLFYSHFDHILGNIPPDYINTKATSKEMKTIQCEKKFEIKNLNDHMVCKTQSTNNELFSKHGGDIIP